MNHKYCIKLLFQKYLILIIGEHCSLIDSGLKLDKLEVVDSFRYLGNMLSAARCCELAVTTPKKTSSKKFRELLPLPSFKTSHHVYRSYVLSVMFLTLFAPKTHRVGGNQKH